MVRTDIIYEKPIAGDLLSLIRLANGSGGKPMTFASLPGEHHEFGALIAVVRAQRTGRETRYPGLQLPSDQQIQIGRCGEYDWNDAMTLGAPFVYVDLGAAEIDTTLFSGEYETRLIRTHIILRIPSTSQM